MPRRNSPIAVALAASRSALSLALDTLIVYVARNAPQEQQERCRAGDPYAMPTDEPSDPVRCARCSGPNGLALEIALDVEGQRVRRLVPSRAVLLERLYGDPVEIALELAQKRSRLDAAVRGRRRRHFTETADPRARSGRLLPKFALKLDQTSLTKLGRVKGWAPTSSS